MPPTSLDSVVNLLSRLVACPSVNPDGREPAGPPFGEGPMTALLAELLDSWGARTRRMEFAPGRWNVVAEFAGARPGPGLLLEAHADTVSAEGMTIDPFTPVVRDGRLYGRGACDTKGPMTAMLLAVRRVLDEDGQLPAPLTFASTGDEEIGAAGVRALVADGPAVGAAIVAEPTGLRIVHAHKGVLRLRIVVAGRAAHSSRPGEGVNAIHAAAQIVGLLEEEADRLAARPHAALGPATISVGTIRGGRQVNVVPDRCEFEVDRRTLPGEDSVRIADVLRERIETLRGEARWRFDVESFEPYPPMAQDPASRVARALARSCEAELGAAEFAVAPYATNAGVLARAGAETVVFGPGSIAQAHTADEFVELDAVRQAADVLARCIREYAG